MKKREMSDDEITGIETDLAEHRIGNRGALVRPLLEALKAKRAEVERLRAEVERLQAQIDRLMMEYCPDEMTGEQKARWAECQVPAGWEKQ